MQVFVKGAAIRTTQIAFPEDVSAAVDRRGVERLHGEADDWHHGVTLVFSVFSAARAALRMLKTA